MMDGHDGLDLWKFVAPEFVFGPEARHLTGRYAKNFGIRKALVVTDPGVIAAGWTAHVLASLEAAGIAYEVYSEVTPDPSAEEVMAGAAVYESARCDGIVAMGGGSPIDCAKGIGIVSSNKKDILELEGVDQVCVPGPPLICVPTTAGSSADVSQFAIITDRQRRTKIAIVSKALVPDVALIDPVMTMTMPYDLTACTGVDALSHAVEAFVSTAHSPATDLHALEAIRLIMRSLPRVLAEPDSIEARTGQMLGSLEAGLAFSNASLGAAHAMSHSLGGFLHLAHGECGSLLLGPVIAFNFDAATERYGLIGEAMGLDLCGKTSGEQKSGVITEIARLRQTVGCEFRLGQAGLRRSDIPGLARKAMRDPCMVTNPRRPSQQELEALYEELL